MFSNIIHFFKSRQMTSVVGVICISIVIILLPVSVKVAFSGLFTTIVYSPFTSIDRFLSDITSAKKNNLELNRQLIELSTRSAKFTEDHYENIRLRRMLGFDLQLPYSLVPAEVVGLKPGLVSKSIVINAGSAKGIEINMPVVTADGIVGKTISVEANSAVVQLLIDHNCKVSAIDQNSRAMGIIRWRGGKILEMGDVTIESEIAVGDTVVSSGLGGIFPPGLLVGFVKSTKDVESTLFKEVRVEPSVDFGSLEEVFVVVYSE